MPVFAVEYDYDDRAQERDAVRPEHRAYFTSLHESGHLIASGPVAGATGALVIVLADDEVGARGLLAADPFAREGFLTDVRVREWKPIIGALASYA